MENVAIQWPKRLCLVTIVKFKFVQRHPCRNAFILGTITDESESNEK